MDGKNKQMDDNALEKITGGVGNIKIEGGDGTDLPKFPEKTSYNSFWEDPAMPKDKPGSLNGIGR